MQSPTAPLAKSRCFCFAGLFFGGLFLRGAAAGNASPTADISKMPSRDCAGGGGTSSEDCSFPIGFDGNTCKKDVVRFIIVISEKI
jgi:hypothetical protein